MTSPQPPRNLLRILPPKLLDQVLDYMHPVEYSGLSCTSHWALEVCNKKVAIVSPASAERQRLQKLQEPKVTRSLTGIEVEYFRKLQLEIQGTCKGYVPIDDDPDL